MNEPRRDEPDDIIPLTHHDAAPERRPSGPGGAPSPEEIEALSPEARLATALVMQAQALEGMRRTQDDLLRRLGESGGGGAFDESLADSLDRFHDRLDDMRDGQRDAAREVRRLRRRSRTQLLVATAAVVAALAAALWWISGALSADDGADAVLDELRSSEARRDAALADALQEERAATEERLADERQALLAGLRDDLDARDALLAGRLAAVTAERDALAGSLAEAEAAAAEQAGRVDSLDADLTGARAAIEGLQDERLTHLGEMTRLRNQLLEKERAHDELLASLEQLREEMEAARAASAVAVSADSGVESLAERLNGLLAAGGVDGHRFVEAGAVAGGVLRDVILVALDAQGLPAGTHPGDRARVVGAADGARLELSVDEPVPMVVLSVPLAATDLSALAAEGLDVPGAVLNQASAHDAIDGILALHDHRLLELGGLDGDALLDVLIEGEGRRLRAARAELDPDGPTLVLTDGAVILGGEERPFFRGVMRLPLPRTDHAAWLAALAR